jgi:hypothetical protein
MGNFINKSLVTKYGLHHTPCPTPLQLHSVTGNKFHQVMQQTKIILCIDLEHQEEITLDIAPIGHNQIILRLPWLALHQPQVNWATGKIIGFSDYCHDNRLPVPSEREELDPPMDSSILGSEACDITQLFVKQSHPNATLPMQGTPGSARWDLYSIEPATLAPGQRQLVDTGISIEIPKGTYAESHQEVGWLGKMVFTLEQESLIQITMDTLRYTWLTWEHKSSVFNPLIILPN